MANFLNKKQVKKLKKRSWKVNPKGFYVNLYVEDFKKSDWKKLCEIAGVDYKHTVGLTLLSFGAITVKVYE